MCVYLQLLIYDLREFTIVTPVPQKLPKEE